MSALRVAALMIAIAGVVDPAFAVRRPSAVPIVIRLPAAQDAEFAEASRIERDLMSLLGGAVSVESGDDPRAVIAIGNAAVDGAAGAPVFAISIPRRSPSVRVVNAPTVRALPGQQSTVSVSFYATGMIGRKTDLLLVSGSVRIGHLQHEWTRENETFEAQFPYSPPVAGFSMVRVSASSAGVPSTEVDVPILARERRFRVFVYEPRPSWSASFVRQAIEASEMFEPITLARTSRGISTHTGGTPAFLGASDLDDVDAIVVSGLEALSAPDQAQLERFVTVRGGTLILLPDTKLPERVRQAFQLPLLEELLLERPDALQTAGPPSRGRHARLELLASELLLPPTAEAGIRALAFARQGTTERAAVFAVYRGKGQVVVAGALDAWRFRGSPDSAFAAFWQGMAADAAATAMPPLTLDVEPMLAQPGEEITLRVTVRETGWTRSAAEIHLPSVSASLIATAGPTTPVRLWPGPAASEYVARFPAPVDGRYDVRVASAGRQYDSVLVVDRAAVTPQRDRTAALAFLAQSSGGEVFPAADLESVAAKLRAIERPIVPRRVHPMRSAWWIVPFVGLLSAEWVLRRRRGQR